MKILVTGGAGFIGSNFIHYILNKYNDYKIVNLDALTYAGNLDNFKNIEINKNYKFIHGNILNKQLVDDLFKSENFDIVIHFAAESHVDNSINNPEIFVQTNILGTQILLEAAKKYSIRFHYIDTDEVFGDLPLDRPDLLFSESSQIKPSSPYSASKASAGLLALSYYKTFNMPITISRCSNNYGPYQFPEKLIPKMILKTVNDEPLTVYGNGLNVRDWIHVNDHCSAIDAIIHSDKFGETYNVGGNSERSNIQIVKIILDYFNKSYNFITYITDRPGHDLRYAINSNKIQKELGWAPKYNFENGIKETIKWYIDNFDWLEKILNRSK